MFGEKKEEGNMPVWQSPKYKESKKRAVEVIKAYESIVEADFWILKNKTKSGSMGDTGLIISHNGCLKLNEAQPEERRFKPECVSLDKEGYGGSLVFTYCCPEQGIYEVGEVSPKNLQNAYPYAMAYKRCFDRVVLKLTGIAFDGIYSDSEADDFRNPDLSALPEVAEPISKSQLKTIRTMSKVSGTDEDMFCTYLDIARIEDMDTDQFRRVVPMLQQKMDNAEAERRANQ